MTRPHRNEPEILFYDAFPGSEMQAINYLQLKCKGRGGHRMPAHRMHDTTKKSFSTTETATFIELPSAPDSLMCHPSVLPTTRKRVETPRRQFPKAAQ